MKVSLLIDVFLFPVESRNSTEGQLIATFEFDGVVYQGPLFAQGHPSSTV